MPAKPTDNISWDTNGTRSGEPPAGKRVTGWGLSEAPPEKWLNWWFNAVYSFVAWVASVTNDDGMKTFQRLRYFGDGSDGVVSTSTLITISRDMYYSSLTISGASGVIRPTRGVRIFVSGTLDLTAASAGALTCGLSNGGAAVNATGGSASSFAVTSRHIGGTAAGPAGATAVSTSNTAGVAGTATASVAYLYGGLGGRGGHGGFGGSVSPATSNGLDGLPTPATTNTVYNPNRVTPELFESAFMPQGGDGGSSGGAGSTPSNGVGTPGGGGGGGRSGGIIWIGARTIARTSGATAAGAIRVNGSDGGAGAAGITGGGGGGGAGGGGGFVVVVYESLTGTSVTGMVQASGGTGGAGGAGATAAGGRGGTGGNGGDGGNGGVVQLLNLSTGVLTETVGSAGTAGTAATTASTATGTAGGGGGAGATVSVAL